MIDRETNLSHRVEVALQRINTISAPLVSAVEVASPGHRFGARKAAHMEELTRQADEMGNTIGLSQRDRLLLKVINRAHDLGRHVEAADNMDTARSGVRHGKISVQLLEQDKQFTVLFDPEELRIITQAIFWHAEKELPDPATLDTTDKTAYELAYVLRDMDKQELLLDVDAVLSPQGAWHQLLMHNKMLRETGPTVQPRYLDFIQNIIANRPLTTEPDDETMRVILQVLTAALSSEASTPFLAGKQVPIQVIGNNYADYMLLQVATLFDMKNNAILSALWQNQRQWFVPRKNFISGRTDQDTMKHIDEVLNTYVRNRLSG